MQPEQTPLSELGAGKHAVIYHFLGGKGLINRLLVLGFTIGTEVVIVQNYGYGPIIIAVKDSRVALGRIEASKVIVQELPGHSK